MPKLLKRLLFLLLLQIFVYSFFTEWSVYFIDGVSINFFLEFIVFLFLFLPLFTINLIKKKEINYEFKINNVIPFLIFHLLLPITHFLILIKYEIFNRRIGTEAIALIYGDMNGLDKFIMKIYDFGQFPFIIISFFTLHFVKNFKHKFFFKLVFYINLTYIIIFSLINSRASLIVLLLLLFIVDGIFNVITKKMRNKFFVIGFCLFILASSIRYIPQIILNNSDIKQIAKEEFLNRANCSKFFKEVYDATKYKGFLYGETISTPFLSLNAIFGNEAAKEKIRNAETGSKQFILINYLHNDNKDDCSCAVVDSYVNYGIFGIILLTLIYIIWIFIVYKLVHLKKLKTFQFLLIIQITFSLLLYEIDGFSLLFSFVKFIPLLLIYYVLNPVSLIRINSDQNNNYSRLRY